MDEKLPAPCWVGGREKGGRLAGVEEKGFDPAFKRISID